MISFIGIIFHIISNPLDPQSLFPPTCYPCPSSASIGTLCMNSTYHPYSLNSPSSNLLPPKRHLPPDFLKLDNLFEEQPANSANNENPTLACQFASVDVFHLGAKGLEGFLPKSPSECAEACLIGDVCLGLSESGLGCSGKRKTWREKLKPVVSIGSYEGSLWPPLARFKAVTAEIELCHRGWKKFCNREFCLCPLRGLRILDIPL